jgi:glycosyltransferase involved in cell wall biosynthesis
LLVLPWDEETGGVISVARNLAHYLQNQGHEVVFFHPGKSFLLKHTKTKLGFSGVQLRLNMPFGPNPGRWLRTFAFPLLFLSSMLQLLWFIHARRIRLLNVHYPGDNSCYFALCRLCLRVPLILSLHGGDAFQNGSPKQRYSGYFKFLLHSADRIVLPSDTYRRKLLEAFPEFGERAIFIHNGINPAQFCRAEGLEHREATDRYILCIADHRDYKGIDLLLHAFKPLLADDPSLRLLLAGDGPLRSDLQRLALSLGIYRQTEFLGTIGSRDIATLLHGCELLVVPSREESFGIVVLEAMACQKPVVAAAVGGIPEIIEHGSSGILVKPDSPDALTEGLQRVLRDGELKRRLAANGYSKVMAQFCFDRTGHAYEKAFAGLMNA